MKMMWFTAVCRVGALGFGPLPLPLPAPGAGAATPPHPHSAINTNAEIIKMKADLLRVMVLSIGRATGGHFPRQLVFYSNQSSGCLRFRMYLRLKTLPLI